MKESTAEELDIRDSVETGDAHGDTNIDESSETDNGNEDINIDDSSETATASEVIDSDLILNSNFTNAVMLAIEMGRNCHEERHLRTLGGNELLVTKLKEVMEQKIEEYDKLVRRHANGNADWNTLEVKTTEIFTEVRCFLVNYLGEGEINKI